MTEQVVCVVCVGVRGRAAGRGRVALQLQGGGVRSQQPSAHYTLPCGALGPNSTLTH